MGVFGRNFLIFGEIFVLQHVVLPRKDPKSCLVWNIVQSRPILLNSDGWFGLFWKYITCFRTLFGGFWGGFIDLCREI